MGAEVPGAVVIVVVVVVVVVVAAIAVDAMLCDGTGSCGTDPARSSDLGFSLVLGPQGTAAETEEVTFGLAGALVVGLGVSTLLLRLVLCEREREGERVLGRLSCRFVAAFNIRYQSSKSCLVLQAI